MTIPAYTPTQEDLESARIVLELLGVDGIYCALDDGIQFPIRVKPHQAAVDLGYDAQRSGFEATMDFYIGIEQVASPAAGDHVCFEGGSWMVVDDFKPDGGLWVLSVYPGDPPAIPAFRYLTADGVLFCTADGIPYATPEYPSQPFVPSTVPYHTADGAQFCAADGSYFVTER
jgi:hypothetical protein